MKVKTAWHSIMILFWLLVAGAVFQSCAGAGTPAQVKDAKAEIGIKYLFEVDGVKIYRFEDAGRYRYFSVGGRMVQQLQTQQSGKSSTTWQDSVIQ